MAPKRKSEATKRTSKKTKKAVEVPSILSNEEIDTLGKDCIDSAKYNNVVQLIAQYDLIIKELSAQEDDKIEHIGRNLSLTLFRCFQKMFVNGVLVRDASEISDEKRQLVAKWVLDKYEQFKTTTLNIIGTELATETSMQLDLVDIHLNLIKLENTHFGKGLSAYYPSISYKKLVNAILGSTHGEVLRDGTSLDFVLLEFLDKFRGSWDLQYYLYANLAEMLDEWRGIKTDDELERISSKVYTVLRIPLLFVNSDKIKDLTTWVLGKLPLNAYKPTQFQSHFQRSFLAFLAYPMSTQQYKNVLLILHKRVIPYMAQPTRLMDFLTDCYNVSGDEIIPILALNSLYELMKQYNLEYPDFYTKLYSLLTPQLLYTRYRGRFFRMCDLFLSSTHLSVNLVASFIKKLARLAVVLSASGVVIVIPFIYNQLKRHPSCMIMVHKPDASSVKEDPFDVAEKDPLKTNAMASSLWELETLMSHYHPNISTLARIFAEPFRKPNYNMEDFLDWSYASLMESEKTRKYRGHAALEFEEFDRVFDKEGEKEGENVYATGWTL